MFDQAVISLWRNDLLDSVLIGRTQVGLAFVPADSSAAVICVVVSLYSFEVYVVVAFSWDGCARSLLISTVAEV